ncbi:hypothetical protein PENSPDRAFT_731511 [Peniophora sp. CONT]|nr:hypothetical protein PENSPDRAFT_731511 [Peniophora sp. CONT]
MAVNWNAPNVLAEQSFDFVNLQHAVGGFYIWELLLGFAYDRELLRRPLTHGLARWGKWVYLACRYSALGAVITTFIGFDGASEVWVVFVFIWAFSAVVLASSLIAIRVIAIWHTSVVMIGLCALVLTAHLATLAYQFSHIDATWVPANSACAVMNTQTNNANITATFFTDLFLLLAMLIGLLRWRDARRASGGIWRVLWNQGLIWLALATIAEVPSMVFVWLNLNRHEPGELIPGGLQMFFTPEMIILVVGATRMYRALSSHFTSSDDLSYVNHDISLQRREQHQETRIAFREVVTLDRVFGIVDEETMQVGPTRVNDEHIDYKPETNLDA